jgi:hypothetical protein
VQAVASRKAEIYIVNALLTYTLVLLMYLDVRLYDNVYFRAVAVTLENLGGFFNTLTYALQSRYVSALQGGFLHGNQLDRNTDSGPLNASYSVGIGDTDISDVTALSTISSFAVSDAQSSHSGTMSAVCRHSQALDL